MINKIVIVKMLIRKEIILNKNIEKRNYKYLNMGIDFDNFFIFIIIIQFFFYNSFKSSENFLEFKFL